MDRDGMTLGLGSVRMFSAATFKRYFRKLYGFL